MVEGPDARWGAFIHPEMYRHARAAGEFFQTVLRAELTERLGLEWRHGPHVLEIAGVPQPLCERFSKRSAEIAAWLEATGTPDDRPGRQEAALATRRGKPEVEGEGLDQAWKHERSTPGGVPMPPTRDRLRCSAPRHHRGVANSQWTIPSGCPIGLLTGGWITVLAVTPKALDVHPLTGPAVSAASATAPPRRRSNASPRGARLHQIVPIAETTPDGTTVQLLAVEARFLDAAHRTRNTHQPIPEMDVRRVRDAGLGNDQAAAARILAESRDAERARRRRWDRKTHTLTVASCSKRRLRGDRRHRRRAHEL